MWLYYYRKQSTLITRQNIYQMIQNIYTQHKLNMRNVLILLRLNMVNVAQRLVRKAIEVETTSRELNIDLAIVQPIVLHR